MTARLVYEAVLIEMNKVNAPSLLLEDFNYLFNKAINLYINKRYNIYDVNQQTTDDIRVLKSTAVLKPTKVISNSGTSTYYGGTPIDSNEVDAVNSLYGATYEVNLPSDYLHILNCICIYKVNRTVKCYNEGSYQSFAAQRLTSDAWPVIINNFYQKPSYKLPYYFIHNVNVSSTDNSLPTNVHVAANSANDTTNGLGTGTDYVKATNLTLTAYKTAIKTIANAIDTEIKAKSASVTNTNGYFTYDGKFLLAGLKSDGSTYIEWNSDSSLSYYKIAYYDVASDTYSPDSYYSYNTTTTPITVTVISKPSDNIEVLNLSKTLTVGDLSVSLVEKEAAYRYGNATPVRLEIRYGKDASVFELAMVHVDYIKTPQYIRLTPELLDLTIDTSQIMEYPDYVCQEIINELVHIVMENASDPRLQTHPIVSQSIAQPAQQLAATPSA